MNKIFFAALLASSQLAFGAGIMGNLPASNDGSQFAALNPDRRKAFLFEMGANASTLSSITIRIELDAAAITATNFPVVTLHSDTGSGEPATELLQFNPPISGYASGIVEYNLPTSPVTLAANTRYWLQLRNTNATGNVNFKASSPAIAYTSSIGATFLQNRFRSSATAAWTNSTINQSWQLNPISSRITGLVDLRDLSIDEDTFRADFEIKDANGNVLQSTPGVVLGPGGSYGFPCSVPAGNYTITAKGVNWLKQAQAGVIISSNGASDVLFSLINGDVDGNNEVGPADFAILSGAFGSGLGDPGYVATADLNRDDEVGPSDFAILSNNFGLEGD